MKRSERAAFCLVCSVMGNTDLQVCDMRVIRNDHYSTEVKTRAYVKFSLLSITQAHPFNL